MTRELMRMECWWSGTDGGLSKIDLDELDARPRAAVQSRPHRNAFALLQALSANIYNNVMAFQDTQIDLIAAQALFVAR